MRRISSLEDAQIVLKELLDWKDTQISKAKDQRGLQIRNAGDATAPTDLVTLRQLQDAVAKTKSTVTNEVVQKFSGSSSSGSSGDTIINNYPVVSDKHGFQGSFSGGGAPIPAGLVCYLVIPKGGVVTAWNILIDQGTCTIQIWRAPTGSALPSSGNSITPVGISISSGNAIRSTDMSFFSSTTLNQWDIVGIYIAAVAGGATQIFTDIEL